MSFLPSNKPTCDGENRRIRRLARAVSHILLSIRVHAVHGRMPSREPCLRIVCDTHQYGSPATLGSQVSMYSWLWPFHSLVHKKHNPPKKRAASRFDGNLRIASGPWMRS